MIIGYRIPQLFCDVYTITCLYQGGFSLPQASTMQWASSLGFVITEEANIMNWLQHILSQKDIVTIDVVGDSITYGMNHCTAEETYVAQFAVMLAKDYPECTVNRYDGIVTDELLPMQGFDGPITIQTGTSNKFINIIRNGIGGNTVQRALKRIDDFTGILADGNVADVTFFMFGINDALKPNPKKYVSVEQFVENYKSLLREVRRINGDKMIVLMSPTWNDISVEEYSEAAKKLAEKEGIPFADQYAVWKEHYDEDVTHFGHGDWLSDCPGDACHPTPLGAYQIAMCMYSAFIGIRILSEGKEDDC